LVGEPLREFQGVLTGVPTFSGEGKTLMASRMGIRDIRD
jgi:circadian clock protein KaiC